MKEFLTTKALPIFLGLVLIVVGAIAVGQAVSKKKLHADLLSTQNSLAEAVGTIELQDGVYARLASQNSDLDRNFRDLLGEHELLSEEFNKREEDIRTLLQTNAQLREDIEFIGNATTTVVVGCNDNPHGNGEDATTTDPDNPIEPDEFVPNLRVDFDLEDSGFRVNGFTESNPGLVLGPPVGRAELTLSQIEPFVVDIAITENRDNDWRAVIYEQQQRLQFDVGVLTVNPRNSTIRWYERMGIGSQLVVTGRGFGVAPSLAVRVGARGEWDINAGPYWSFGSNNVQRGASMGFTVYPFSRRRDR